MKKIIVSLVLLPAFIGAAGISDSLTTASKPFFPTVTNDQSKVFTSVTEAQQVKLTDLQREREKLLEQGKKFSAIISARIEETKTHLDTVNHALVENSDNEFLNKKLAILNEHLHVLKDLQQLWDQLITIIDQSIKSLQDFLADPSFVHYKKELKLDERTLSFEDLEQLNQLIQEQETTIDLLVDQEKNADAEYINRKRTVEVTTQAYRKKKDEQAALGKTISAYYTFDVSRQQALELLKLEEQLYTDKKERDDLRFSEIEHKKSLIKIRLFVARLKLDILKDALKKIKPMVTVSEADVLIAKDDLAKKRQESFAIKEAYMQDIDAWTQEMRHKEKTLDELAKQESMTLGSDLNDWTREPKRTVAAYLHFYQLAAENEGMQVLQRKKDYLEAQVILEEEKIDYESAYAQVKESFHKITAQKFSSDDQIRQEIKQYDAPKAETKANLSLYADKRNASHELLNRQKKVLEKIKERRVFLQQQRNSLFKGQADEYIRCLELLNHAQKSVHEQIEFINKTVGVYGDILATVTKTLAHIDFIVDELSSITVWQRPEHAISWQGILSFIPSLRIFFVDLGSYVLGLRSQALFESHADNSFGFIGWCMLCFIVIVMLKVLQRVLTPIIVMWALNAQRMESRLMRTLGVLSAEIAEFIRVHLVGLAIWLYILKKTYSWHMYDPHPYIFVCLGSLVYCIYLAHDLIARIEWSNHRYNYVFLSPHYQPRFLLVISTAVYSTIALSFFRQAFILGNYLHSELPTILLAINSIILQVCLLLLISKEHIIRLLPRHDGIWQRAHDTVNQYFYLIVAVVVGIMILSNSYIGFGKLVLYIILHILYTILTFFALIWFNIALKRASSFVFFHTEEGGVTKERFAYGKTLYSLFIITLFLCCIFTGLILAAKIWGWPDNLAAISKWSDVIDWLAKPIILQDTETPLSVLSIIKLLLFIMSGFVVSFIINNFVMSKIFDVLLVDTGVQNTAASITRYLIVITAVVLGFQSIGLAALVWYLIGALIVGIGWVIKDPIGDFIAYFIILVQRPIKIGDYVRLDDENLGVVRKITPRSVVIRRKNSTSIIVPNTSIINKPVVNWNYQRGFVAFDDIVVTIAYKEDPSKVRSLLYKILDDNPYVLKNPKPIVRLDNFGDFGFVFMVRGFLSSNYTLDQWDIASDIRLDIVKVLRAQNIHIALPARVILKQQGYSDSDVHDVEKLKN